MHQALLAPLVIWQNFYVIIGSAAATLTGLMFIVVTLVAGTRQQRKANDSFGAFATPNVVHFCAALFVAAVFSAPWQALWNVSLPLGLCGLGGVTYVVFVFRRLRLQSTYQPVMEDWLGHTILPLVSYTLFVVAAIVIPSDPTLILFFVGAATIMLLFIGIHNAWDTITYITIENSSQSEDKPQEK